MYASMHVDSGANAACECSNASAAPGPPRSAWPSAPRWVLQLHQHWGGGGGLWTSIWRESPSELQQEVERASEGAMFAGQQWRLHAIPLQSWAAASIFSCCCHVLPWACTAAARALEVHCWSCTCERPVQSLVPASLWSLDPEKACACSTLTLNVHAYGATRIFHETFWQINHFRFN